MNRLAAYLRRPAVLNPRPWIVVVTASLLVGFLLGFLQPFGIERIESDIKLYIIIGYTLVTAISTSISGYLFPLLFRKFYDPSKWSVGKSLINQIVLIMLIALGNFFFDWSFTDRAPEFFWPVMRSYILITFLIGIIPAVISSFIILNHSLKRNLADAETINSHLAERLKREINTEKIENEAVTLTGSTKESISIYPDTILYIESSGNYVRINYIDGREVKQKELRTTITRIEKELQQYQYIIRCHRAFMVNRSHITTAQGNSQGLRLHLNHIREEIPVSRSYIKLFRD